MAGTTIGSAYVQILPSAEGIKGNLESVLGGDAASAGLSIGNKLGSSIVKAVAALGIGKMISKAITDGMDFEQSMAKASTLFTGTGEELAGLESNILSISSSTGVAASQLAEAAYSAESASVPMQNLGSMIEASAKLATAGFTDIDTALSATAKTMNAYGMMSENAAVTQANMEQVQRVLIQTQNKGITTVGELGASLAQVTGAAASANVSFEQVGAAMALMTARGTPTAQATTQLRSAIAELSKSGTTASDALAAAAEGTEYAGQSFSEMMSNGASLGDVMGMLQGYADKTGVSMLDLWGSIEGGNAAMAIASDLETFNDDLAAMTTDADVVGEAFGTMSDTVSFKLQTVKTSLQNVGIKAFSKAADGMANALDGISAVLDIISPALDGLGTAFESLFSAIGQTVGEMLGMEEGFSASEAIGQLLKNVIDGLATGIQFLADHMDVIAPIVATVTGAFVALKGAMAISNISSMIGKISGLGKGLGSAASAAGAAGGATSSLGAGLAGAVPGILAFSVGALAVATAIRIIGPYLQDLGEAISTIVATAGTAIAAIITAVTPAIGIIVGGVVQIADIIGTTLVTAMDTAANAIATVITAIGDAISGVIDSISGLVDSIGSAAESIGTAFGTVNDSIAGIIDSISVGIATVVTAIGDSISGVLDSVARIFESMGQAALDAGTGFSALADAVIRLTNETGIADLGATLKTVSSGIQDISSAASGSSEATALFNSLTGSLIALRSAGNSLPEMFSNLDLSSGLAASLNKANSIVSAGIAKLKAQFEEVQFKFNTRIALPHFIMNGKFDAESGTVPKVSVQWYAKGGILTAPTIFGMMGNTLLGGGEAGPEAIAPISELEKYLGSGTVYNVYINGIKYNTDEYIDDSIKGFIETMVRKQKMYAGA